MRETTRLQRRPSFGSGANGALALLGRALFASIFLLTASGHFRAPAIAAAAGEGLPLAGLLVPGSGFMMLGGGLAVLLGWRTRLGAWMLAVFLLPATFLFHDYWTIEDVVLRHREQIAFMKNLSLLGGALVLAELGAGPWSVDARRRRTVSSGDRSSMQEAQCSS